MICFNKMLMLLLMTMFISCRYSNYADGVKSDTKKSFLLHKFFFNKMAFSGTIVEKKYCAECDLNKYQITINLKYTEPKNIDIGNMSFQPFYFFSSNQQLTISVTKDTFDGFEQGWQVEKRSNSDTLASGLKKYNLISKGATQWLPE